MKTPFALVASGLFALLMSTGLPVAAQTTVVTLQDGLNAYAGTRDNSIYSDMVNNTNGGGQYIILGRANGAATRRGLVAFDISGLPADIQIVDVTLELVGTMSQGAAQPVAAHRLSAAWGEGTVDAAFGGNQDAEGQGDAAAAGDATWNANQFGASTWTSPGGDYTATASGTGTASAAVFTIRGASMATDVQDWVDGQANHGWILIANTDTMQTAKRIASADNPTAANRPKLIVEYQPVVAVPRAHWRR